MPIRRLRRPLVTAALAATALLGIGASAASAGLLVESAPDCNSQEVGRVFAPWLDYSNYFLAPDGGMENGAEGWALDGAAVVDGNESFYVGGGGSKSLSLPAGSSATSPTVCVGLAQPTVRFFVRKASGGLLSSLRVDALVEDRLGLIAALPVGTVLLGSSSWQPSAPMVVLASLLPLLPGDHTPVRFRVTAQGGSWQIDDFYVDPYHTR